MAITLRINSWHMAPGLSLHDLAMITAVQEMMSVGDNRNGHIVA